MQVAITDNQFETMFMMRQATEYFRMDGPNFPDLDVVP